VFSLFATLTCNQYEMSIIDHNFVGYVYADMQKTEALAQAACLATRGPDKQAEAVAWARHQWDKNN